MRDDFIITRQQFWIGTIISLCVIIVAICYGWITWNTDESGKQTGDQGNGISSGQELQADGNPGVSEEDGRQTAETNTKPSENEGGETETGGNVISSSADYVLPVQGEIFRHYSISELTYYPTLNQYMVHQGIDILAPIGAEVCAAAEGLVSKIYDDPTMGKTIWVAHQGEIITVYSNLDDTVSVEEGDVVTKGQTIGKAGATAIYEASDEPHIHVEVLVNGKSVDPVNYFK